MCKANNAACVNRIMPSMVFRAMRVVSMVYKMCY